MRFLKPNVLFYICFTFQTYVFRHSSNIDKPGCRLGGKKSFRNCTTQRFQSTNLATSPIKRIIKIYWSVFGVFRGRSGKHPSFYFLLKIKIIKSALLTVPKLAPLCAIFYFVGKCEQLVVWHYEEASSKICQLAMMNDIVQLVFESPE